MLTEQIKTENFSGGKGEDGRSGCKNNRNLFIDSLSVYFCINLLLGVWVNDQLDV